MNMEFYGTKFLRNRISRQIDGHTEVRDAMVFDVLPDQRIARVRIQGSDTLVDAHYPRQWASAPSWLVPRMAVKINHPAGNQGWIELLGPGGSIPTPISGAALPTIPNPSDGILSGGTISPATGLDVSIPATSYLIAGRTYSIAATSLTMPANPSAHQYRYDLVVVDAAGSVSYVEGTSAGSNPAIPAIPSGHVLLGKPILRYHEQAAPMPISDIGRIWEAPRTASVAVSAASNTIAWGSVSADIITATVLDQYGETITPAAAGYALYTFTLDWLVGNGSIDSTASPTQIIKNGTSSTDYDQTFSYVRNNLVSDASPTFQISVSTNPAIVGFRQIILNDANGNPMYGAGGIEPVTPGASVTIDWTSKKIQSISMAENTAFTFSGASSGDKLILVIRTNGFTPTFPVSVNYSTDIPSTIIGQLSADGKYDYLGFIFSGSKYDLVAVTRGFTA